MVSAESWNQSTIALEAATDLAAGVCVKFASGKATLAATVTDVILGVTRDSAKAGETVAVVVAGMCDIVASAAISEGAVVGTTVTTGKGKALTVGTDTTQYIVGTALEAASAADNVIAVMLTIGGRAA